jgi:hypothetical protein
MGNDVMNVELIGILKIQRSRAAKSISGSPFTRRREGDEKNALSGNLSEPRLSRTGIQVDSVTGATGESAGATCHVVRLRTSQQPGPRTHHVLPGHLGVIVSATPHSSHGPATVNRVFGQPLASLLQGFRYPPSTHVQKSLSNSERACPGRLSEPARLRISCHLKHQSSCASDVSHFSVLFSFRIFPRPSSRSSSPTLPSALGQDNRNGLFICFSLKSNSKAPKLYFINFAQKIAFLLDCIP